MSFFKKINGKISIYYAFQKNLSIFFSDKIQIIAFNQKLFYNLIYNLIKIINNKIIY